MSEIVSGRSLRDGLSSQATEPVPVSALRASIPSAMAERKAVSTYLRTLAVRSYLNMRRVPNWRVLTILRHKWMMAAYSLAADSIERGEQHGTQEGWLVRLDDGIFFAGEAHQTVAASAMSAREGQDAEERLEATPASAVPAEEQADAPPSPSPTPKEPHA